MPVDRPLTDLLLRAAGERLRVGDGADADVEGALAAALANARVAYPAVKLDAAVWLSHVARVLPEQAPLPEALVGLHLEELWLCAACLEGDSAAILALDRTFRERARAVFSKLGVDAALGEELMQELRTVLLVSPPGRSPKLASYGGKGALAAWLKVVVTRAVLRKKKRAPKERRADSLLLEQLSDDSDDAELEQIRIRYKDEFESSVSRAFERLRGDQRTLLRMYVTDGLTLDDLAEHHRCNASTVSRWLTKIREQLLHEARAHLTAKLNLRPSEYDSLHRALRSRLHVSVERLLAEDD